MAQELSHRESIKNATYFCGVVEGFYGRPWTLDQRKHLYIRSNQLGFNTYLYAPKDDIKHRAAWREPYNNAEIAILRDLIESAKSNGVDFVYALSPGLDIIYSSEEEMLTLQRKIEQVHQAGCQSFALLFDDIEPKMNDRDKEYFNSFATAHVHVTNMVYDKINAKKFMFCPTEYCETRAVPTLQDSEYLNTVGEKLRPDIHILWTGPRVISQFLTVEHLTRVGKVLRRKPMLWDNLHANDYDQKRIFMGPFKGRSVNIKNYTSGLLLNPNCKYEANFVPFHTLSDWNAADRDADEQSQHDSSTQAMLNVNCDGPMEYSPERSYKNAIAFWIPDFNAPTGPNIPQLPKVEPPPEVVETPSDINRSKSEMTVTSSSSDSQSVPLEEIIHAEVIASENIEPEEINSLTIDYAQPMEEDEPPANDDNDTTMTSLDDIDSTNKPDAHVFSHISALVDFFYLPFECGHSVQVLFRDLVWLMENASVMKKTFQEIETLDPMQSEWLARYDNVGQFLTCVVETFTYICEASNKALVSELISYAWEAHGISVVLLAVSRWMMQGVANDYKRLPDGAWNYNFKQEEPWITDGGFVFDCIKLLCKNANIEKLFNSRIVLPLSVYTYDIRPYTDVDEDYISELSSTNLTKNEELIRLRTTLFRDRSFRPFLLAGSQHNFMCEEVSSPKKPICFAAAHQNGQAVQDYVIHYKQQLKLKYATEVRLEGFDMNSIVNEIDFWFPVVSSDVFAQYPSWVDTHFALDTYDAVPMKRILQAVAVSLSINGSTGMFVTVPNDESDRQQYFLRLGFHSVGQSECKRFALLGFNLNSVEENVQMDVQEH